jgi:hypothetical protein
MSSGGRSDWVNGMKCREQASIINHQFSVWITHQHERRPEMWVFVRMN